MLPHLGLLQQGTPPHQGSCQPLEFMSLSPSQRWCHICSCKFASFENHTPSHPHALTCLLPHTFTHSHRHVLTPSLYHNHTPPQFTPSLLSSLTSSQLHNLHSHTLTPSHSQLHSLHPHAVTPSQLHNLSTPTHQSLQSLLLKTPHPICFHQRLFLTFSTPIPGKSADH